MLMPMCGCHFLCIHTFALIFIIEIVCVFLDFTTQKQKKTLVCRGFLEYVVNARDS